MSPPLILASTSSARRMLLQNAGLAFDAVAPGVDEEEVKLSLAAEKTSADAVASTLAEMKAVRVSQRQSQALVIGADQVLSCEGRLFDKPADAAAARAHLQVLRGRTHELVSALCVAQGGTRIWHHVGRARLTMRPFDDAFLDAYLARAGDSVTTSVGCYRLEGLGPHLFSRIDGDYFTILGLPLLALLPFLAGHGIDLR
jgi:septum formation protein